MAVCAREQRIAHIMDSPVDVERDGDPNSGIDSLEATPSSPSSTSTSPQLCYLSRIIITLNNTYLVNNIAIIGVNLCAKEKPNKRKTTKLWISLMVRIVGELRARSVVRPKAAIGITPSHELFVRHDLRQSLCKLITTLFIR